LLNDLTCHSLRYNLHMAIRRPSPPPSGKVERVRPVRSTGEMDKHHLQYKIGTVEDVIGDEVVVRFGEVVVQVPAQWLLPVG